MTHTNLDIDIPEHLPGEPELRRGPLRALGVLLGRLVVLLAALAVSLPLWPLYLLLRLVLDRPPHVGSAGRHLSFLRRIATARPPRPGLRLAVRLGLALDVLARWATVPLAGLAWYLDALMYGRALREIRILAPLFEVSAARSGSTQLARYLEDDPEIRAPSVLQTLYPYVWLWKLSAATLGRILPPERVRAAFEARVSEAFLQRHELDPYRTDSFEVLYAVLQLGDVSLCLGPEIARAEYSGGVVRSGPHPVWDRDFPDFIDALGRKVLFAARREPGAPPRLLIKGHFLAAAPELERRYPDARFLTVIRAPAKRTQSTLNHVRVNPVDALLGHVPWPWLVAMLIPVEIAYCDDEMAFYGRTDGARRCVVRFDDYVRDLEGTLRRVYRECLDQTELPPHLPREHAPRVRENYAIDRSLEQLGIDVAALNQRLADYNAWCKGKGAPAQGAEAAREPATPREPAMS